MSSTYLLSPINHKENYHIDTPDGEQIDLYIDKSFENNLRERNPQLGLVEAIPIDNPYNLVVGDIVAVNHFTFYGDIGTDKSFKIQPHVEYGGKKLFKVLLRQIFFKYNNKTPEPVGEFLLCRDVQEQSTLCMNPNSGDFFWTKEFKQEGIIFYGNNDLPAGTKVLVLKNAFYLITLDKVDYFKVLKDEIVAKIIDGEGMPVGRNMIVEYLPEKPHSFLDLSQTKKGNNCRAKVLAIGEINYTREIDGDVINCVDHSMKSLNINDEIQVWRNQGVEYDGKRIIDTEMMLWRWDEKAENELGIAV